MEKLSGTHNHHSEQSKESPKNSRKYITLEKQYSMQELLTTLQEGCRNIMKIEEKRTLLLAVTIAIKRYMHKSGAPLGMTCTESVKRINQNT